MIDLIPVILCGGSGTRLWPKSRAILPKPFLPLVGEDTLFSQTVGRCAEFGAPIVVTGTAHLAHVEDQLGSTPGARVIVEPDAMNTAPAIALAAASLPEEAVMLVCPSDHHIGDRAAFCQAALNAAELAREGWLVAFGIAASAPETGFGYIRHGEPIGGAGFRVAEFIEKPDRERAEAFVADGGYSWNAGIFVFRAGDFMRELAAHRPQMADAVRKAVAAGREDGRRFHPDATSFAEIDPESVDYAVMENTARAAVVPARMAWSDIGNWPALRDARERDEHGNCVRGPAELVDCRNVLVESDGPRVSVIGLEDVIVVVDGNEVLVTTADGAQRVGQLSGAANQ